MSAENELVLLHEAGPKNSIASPNPPCEVSRPPHNPNIQGLCSGSLTPTPLCEPHAPPRIGAEPLYKQRSWSPDAFRDEAWLRRKGNWKNRRSKSVTDEDVDELKACIELGFGFGSSREVELDQRLSDTLPALELYYVVSENYRSTMTTTPSSDSDSPSPLGSPHTTIYAREWAIYNNESDNCVSGWDCDEGENPQTVKSRLKQWAQVVACAVRQSSSG
ncbi:uncharacterized protein LOC114719188 [Neltuma alba]|uniref:uncharacterized protein LOC114719188 n=1 Tax=Neltuma alba TaxID=207710 RepID=UPI0010A55349|nr:uncharacterized protein LOC114719188 [Prosopis alba]